MTDVHICLSCQFFRDHDLPNSYFPKHALIHPQAYLSRGAHTCVLICGRVQMWREKGEEKRGEGRGVKGKEGEERKGEEMEREDEEQEKEEEKEEKKKENEEEDKIRIRI